MGHTSIQKNLVLYGQRVLYKRVVYVPNNTVIPKPRVALHLHMDRDKVNPGPRLTRTLIVLRSYRIVRIDTLVALWIVARLSSHSKRSRIR